MSGDNLIPFSKAMKVTEIVKSHWSTRYQTYSAIALGRAADLLRFKKGLKYSEIIEFFSSCLDESVHPAEFDAVMREYESFKP